jgi:hypothetical protein
VGRLLAFLAGLAAGLATLVWLFRGGKVPKHLGPPKTFEVEVTITSAKEGCGVTISDPDVTLKQTRRDKIHWNIRHTAPEPSPERIQVCMGEWKHKHTDEAPTEDQEGGNHCKNNVRRGGPPMTIKAQAKKFGDVPLGEYKYSVLIDGKEVLDPIVRLVI